MDARRKGRLRKGCALLFRANAQRRRVPKILAALLDYGRFAKY
jgi:hypothetical protein